MNESDTITHAPKKDPTPEEAANFLASLTRVVTTKARQPAQQWVRFYKLESEEVFYIGRYTVKKSGLWTYRLLTFTGPLGGSKAIAPWTKVRSQRPVKRVSIENPAKN